MLVTVASMVSEISMANAKEACCAGDWKSAAVTPVICKLDETTTTGTCGPVGVGVSGFGSVGTTVGSSDGAWEGTWDGAGDGSALVLDVGA